MPYTTLTRRIAFCCACLWMALVSSPTTLLAQRRNDKPAAIAQSDFPPSLYHAMQWRNIGPYRGGRSLAVAGHPSQPQTFYFGATGGGVWKTSDGGQNWNCVSDSFFTSASVGALAVAPSDAQTIYAGMGERDIRGNAAVGDGIYRSSNGGKTWQHMGLRETRVIGRIAVHPTNSDLVYVAALGSPFATSKDRGVYRSKDGGKNWEKVLYVDERSGAVHISLDPNNPRVLYAAIWECYRNPWSMSSGGPGSGLYKSTDGGDTWVNISKKPGLPKGVLGKIGVSISPVNGERVYAIIENTNGGVFVSDDGGENWSRVNEERKLRQRAWYYTHIIADPQQVNTVYVLNVNWFRSIDGGKTFSQLPTQHGDHHDLWLDPSNNQRLILADDGGASVSYNAGASLTEQDIPTAQFYHVAVDNHFPYRIYGAQQDNSTVAIYSRTSGFSIGNKDWYGVAGCECGYVVAKPNDPEVTFGGCYDGYLSRYDKRTDDERDVSVWPESSIGAGAVAKKYRFQWTYPIVFSPHNPNRLYATGNRVFMTEDEGHSWAAISPDLTRNDSSKIQSSGGPITQDNTGAEYYCTIFAFAESPVRAGVLWAGSDDGLVHVSQDGGKSWVKVTPTGLPDWATISMIEPSPTEAGTAYVAAIRYKLGDMSPYVYKTTDYGKTWTKIVSGIGAEAFVRVVRADPVRRGLLYAGTETGMVVSFDDGQHWQSLQLNLPVAPIHDIALQTREHDLVVATHGRSFWVLDDLTPLRQLAPEQAKKKLHLHAPRHAYRMDGGGGPSNTAGQNAPNGLLIHYSLDEASTDTLHVEIRDSRDSLVAHFTSKTLPNGDAVKEEVDFYTKTGAIRNGVPSIKAGHNRFVWNLRQDNATNVPGALFWGQGVIGPKVVPGMYKVRLRLGKEMAEQSCEVKADPRVGTTAQQWAQLDKLQRQVHQKLSATHSAVNRIRSIRKQMDAWAEQLKGHAQSKAFDEMKKKVNEKLTKIEEALIQTKIQSNQDMLNFPIRLNDKLSWLAGSIASAEAQPTTQQMAHYDELAALVDAQLASLKTTLDTELAAVNDLVRSANLPAIQVK